MTIIKQIIIFVLLLNCKLLIAQSSPVAELHTELLKATNDSLQMKSIIALGKYYSSQNEDSCMYYYKKAEEIVKKHPNTILEIAYIMEYGNYYKNIKNDLVKSRELYNKGLEIARTLRNEKQINKFLANLGIVSAQEGKYYDAIKKYLEVIKAEEKSTTKDSSVLIIFYTNIASFYNRLNYIEQQRMYIDKIPLLLTTKKDTVNYLIAAGECLASENKNTLAINNYKALLIQATQLNNLPLQQLSHSALADIYLKQKDYKSALSFVQNEHSIAVKMKNALNEMSAYTHYGEVYNGLGNYAYAITNFNKAIDYFRKNNIEDNLFKALKGISHSYQASGDYKKAYQSFTEYEALKESMVGKEKQKMIAELDAQYELADKQEEITKKEIENKMQLEKIAENKKQATGLIIIIGIILSLLAFSIFNYLKKQKLNKALLLGKQKIEEQARQLAENNNAKNKLFAIIAHDLRSPINMYQGLASSVSFLLKNNKLQDLQKISEHIDNTGLQLDLLLTNLMQWSNSQQNELMYQEEKINMLNLCNEIVPIYIQIAGTKNITIATNIETDLLLQSSKNQLSIIIRNLLDNAIKYSQNDSLINLRIFNNKDTGVVINICNTFREDDYENTKRLKEILSNSENNTFHNNGSIGLDLIIKSVKSLRGSIAVATEQNILDLKITIPPSDYLLQKNTSY